VLEFIDKIAIPSSRTSTAPSAISGDDRDGDRVGDDPVRRSSSSRSPGSWCRTEPGRAAHRPALNYWLVVIFATIGNTIGSLIAYASALGGRPFLQRYGKYILIREHEIEVADRFFEKWGADRVLLPAPADRPDVHQLPAGVARMDLRKFIVYSTAGAFLWSMLLVWAERCSARTGWTSATCSSVRLAIAVAVVVVALACSGGAWDARLEARWPLRAVGDPTGG